MTLKPPKCTTDPIPNEHNLSERIINFRDCQLHAIKLLKSQVSLESINCVIELGGSTGECIKNQFPSSQYFNIDIEEHHEIPTIKCDATKSIPLDSECADFIYSNNTLEHVTSPWTVANELSRILKPGGFLYISAPWSWRYHPVPIDYWRFSPTALTYLFCNLMPIDFGFNLAYRRDDMRGFWTNEMDAVPIDDLGGVRENWLSFAFFVKV